MDIIHYFLTLYIEKIILSSIYYYNKILNWRHGSWECKDKQILTNHTYHITQTNMSMPDNGWSSEWTISCVVVPGDTKDVEIPRGEMEVVKGQMVVLHAWYSPNSDISKNSVLWHFMGKNTKQVGRSNPQSATICCVADPALTSVQDRKESLDEEINIRTVCLLMLLLL